MDMIVFTIKFNQCGPKILTNSRENIIQIMEDVFSKDITAKFSHKDQMDMYLKYAMSPSSNSIVLNPKSIMQR